MKKSFIPVWRWYHMDITGPFLHTAGGFCHIYFRDYVFSDNTLSITLSWWCPV